MPADHYSVFRSPELGTEGNQGSYFKTLSALDAAPSRAEGWPGAMEELPRLHDRRSKHQNFDPKSGIHSEVRFWKRTWKWMTELLFFQKVFQAAISHLRESRRWINKPRETIFLLSNGCFEGHSFGRFKYRSLANLGRFSIYRSGQMNTCYAAGMGSNLGNTLW